MAVIAIRHQNNSQLKWDCITFAFCVYFLSASFPLIFFVHSLSLSLVLFLFYIFNARVSLRACMCSDGLRRWRPNLLFQVFFVVVVVIFGHGIDFQKLTFALFVLIQCVCTVRFHSNFLIYLPSLPLKMRIPYCVLQILYSVHHLIIF